MVVDIVVGRRFPLIPKGVWEPPYPSQPCALHQLRDADVEGLSKPKERQGSDVVVATLNSTNIRTIHLCKERESFLRNALAQAHVANRFPKGYESGVLPLA